MSLDFDATAVCLSELSAPIVERPSRPQISFAPPVQDGPVAGMAGSFLPKPILTGREIQVLTCWIRCDSKPEVAKSLFLSLGTVNTHLTRIRAKYAAVGRPASTKASLVARALQDGMIDIAEL